VPTREESLGWEEREVIVTAVLAHRGYWVGSKPAENMVLFTYYCILVLFTYCCYPASAPPKCLNKDFTTVPSYVTHQWVPIAKNGSLMPFPYNTTVNGELRERFKRTLSVYGWSQCTAKNQYRKFETNIPVLGIARPHSQFPHSYVCKRFIYTHDRSAYSAAGNMLTHPGDI
jgi:hypothetical protein